MECLELPIDHRLRRVIREAKHIDRNKEEAEHLQLLHDFGSSLEVDGDDYPIFDFSFGLEMARPSLKGGVLIVLERPHSRQVNSDGFMEGVRRCRTIDAVSNLIHVVNNGKVRFEEVSVFDTIPFLDETITGPENQDLINCAQEVFADMVRAKDPDVILCCAKTETRNPLIQKLRARGIGRVFFPGTPKLAEFGLSSILVNAFHPSYAVNRYPIFCCFRRLLVLEFTKAFALLRQGWVEEPWMRALRSECRMKAERNLAESNVDGTSTHSYLESQLEELLESLDEQIQKFLLPKAIEVLSPDTQHQLVGSNITWLSCDIAWTLEQTNGKETFNSGMPQYFLCKFRGWAHKAWPADQRRRNSSNLDGYYSHVPLLIITSTQPTHLIRSLENTFLGFLRDLNLSLSWNHNFVNHNLLAQVCAFRRLAAVFEDILEEIAENGILQDGTEIHNEMAALKLN